MASPIILGNWKMNNTKEEASSFFSDFFKKIPQNFNDAFIGFAPPYTLLDHVDSLLKEAGRTDIKLGSQSIHWAEKGAHTGEISARMLKDFNVSFSIVGHSERRSLYGETDLNVALRTKEALINCITPILCVGENKDQFESGHSQEVVINQLSQSLDQVQLEAKTPLIIAYEPVWAIGTGLSATPESANTMCKAIKNFLRDRFSHDLPVLYGGSVDDSNIASLYQESHIDGFLVGGASLKPSAFTNMINSCLEV